MEADDVVEQAPGAPSADQILDKYLQALGDAERVASLTSWVAKGSTVGYGLDAEKRPMEIFARAPNQRATIIHEEKGTTTTVYDGRQAWIAAPNLPLPVLPLTGGELEGAGLDAVLSFPGQIKQVFPRWRVGDPVDIDDKEVRVLQATSAGGNIATLYFDSNSGLLVRMIRYAKSPVGRLPTQIDFSDYRQVQRVRAQTPRRCQPPPEKD
jgi:outer membrane lipoprotein-sorting protein